MAERRTFVIAGGGLADRLRAVLQPGARLAIIRVGWIGCEVAATARESGAEVTLIEHAGAPLRHVLGRRLGGFLADAHRSHGVRVLTSVRVDRVEHGLVPGVDQYDLGLEHFGLHAPTDRLVVHGTPGDGPFHVVWVGAGGTGTAGMHVDGWGASAALPGQIEAVTGVDAAPRAA